MHKTIGKEAGREGREHPHLCKEHWASHKPVGGQLRTKTNLDLSPAHPTAKQHLLPKQEMLETGGGELRRGNTLCSIRTALSVYREH